MGDSMHQIGRIIFGPDKKEIAPHPKIGEGDARRVPYDKTEEWDMCDRPVPPDFGDGYDEPVGQDVGQEKIEESDLPSVPKMVRQRREEELGQGVDGGGKRYNKGKNLMELLPPEWAWALADVTTQGSKKYEKRNWEKGMDWSTMIGCMERHIKKFEAGERYDGPEFNLEKGTTGCHHLAMVAWNALALMTYDLRRIGNNDLPQPADLKRVNATTSDLSNSSFED